MSKAEIAAESGSGRTGASGEETPVFLSLLPARPGERRFAFAVMAVSLAVFVALAPFAKVQLPRLDAFIPLYQSALVISHLIIAVLLFGQFSIVRTRGLLILASAYLFTTLMVVAHTLSFPGLFAPGGLLGSGAQTTAWLYMIWHGGFSLLVIGYALFNGAKIDAPPNQIITFSVIVVAAVVAVVMALTSAGQDWLPAIMDGDRYTPMMSVVVLAVWLIGLFALLLLWRRKADTALDLWLVVVVGAWLLDVALAAVFNGGRFDLGFYAGRIYGLLASGTVLLVLLLETRALYVRHALELQQTNQALRESKARLRQLNETLEQRVQERTQRLEEEAAERERMEAALRDVQKLEAIGRMTGGIAHDFNNLLAVIIGNVDELMERFRDRPDMESLLAINHAAERGARLIRQLMTFSRNKLLKTDTIDLKQRARDMGSFLTQSLRGDIRLVFDWPEDLWPVRCDGDELDLAMVNLCVNARDAMPDGGLVRIAGRNIAAIEKQEPSLGLAGDYVQLSLSDTGHGIAGDDLKRVFEPFFTTKEIGKGTGLGLCQVYGFCQQAGGRAMVESVEGQGTTVTLYLPRAVVETDAPSVPNSGTARRGRGRVLLVEDDDAVAAMATRMLTMLGYESHRARDARTALALLLGGQQFDVLFSDIVMPGGMSGQELAQKVRSHFPALPILLASGIVYAAAEVDRQGFDIIAKPYRADALADALERVIRESYSRQRNRA